MAHEMRAADGSATLSVGDKLAAHQHASIVASTQAEPDDVVFLLKASAADAVRFGGLYGGGSTTWVALPAFSSRRVPTIILF